MTTMAKSQIHVGCLVLFTALGALAHPIQKEIEKYLQMNGVEWACRRLKAIWNAANLLRSGDRESARKVYQDTSIAYHHGTLEPKGPMAPLVRAYLAAERPSAIKRLGAALRFYTCLQLTGEISQSQRRKAEASISGPPMFTDDLRKIFQVSLMGCPPDFRVYTLVNSGKDWIPPMEWRFADGLNPLSAYFSRWKLPANIRKEFSNELQGEGLRRYPYLDMTLSLMTEPWIPQSLEELVPCPEFRGSLRDELINLGLPEKEFAGKIFCIQEPGCKARVVCEPTAFLQLAFLPLHRRLQDLAEEFFPAESCVKDQLKGVYSCMELMEAGGEVFSLDLSSATDRFPREFSIWLLEELGMKNYGKALTEVCESWFDSPWGPTQYSTGQPMGLMGSFPLFHLSHLVAASGAVFLAKEKAKRYGNVIPFHTFKNGAYFQILGDDIVFADYKISEAYRHILTDVMGVELSESKCYRGNVAEFAGFVILKNRKGQPVAFRPYKSPSGPTVSNGINFLDSLGSRVAHVSRYWRRQWSIFSLTTFYRNLDLSPLVPTTREPYGSSPYRGDTRIIHSIRNRLLWQMEGLPENQGSGMSPKFSSFPLFSDEAGQSEIYGFNADKLAGTYVDRNVPEAAASQHHLFSDPLMKAAREGRYTDSFWKR